MSTIDELRSQMRAEKCPLTRYKQAKAIIERLRSEETGGQSTSMSTPKPVARREPKQDPVASYREAKKRLAAKGATPAPSSPPAHKHSGGAQGWPPAHLRQAVADAQRHQ